MCVKRMHFRTYCAEPPMQVLQGLQRCRKKKKRAIEQQQILLYTVWIANSQQCAGGITIVDQWQLSWQSTASKGSGKEKNDGSSCRIPRAHVPLPIQSLNNFLPLSSAVLKRRCSCWLPGPCTFWTLRGCSLFSVVVEYRPAAEHSDELGSSYTASRRQSLPAHLPTSVPFFRHTLAVTFGHQCPTPPASWALLSVF